MPSPEANQPSIETVIDPKLDLVEQERLIISEQIAWIQREVYLCDRNETDFYIVSNGVQIPSELQEKLLNDGESVDVITRAFEYAGIERPNYLFTPEVGALVVEVLRPYEVNQYAEMTALGERLGELDPDREDEAIE